MRAAVLAAAMVEVKVGVRPVLRWLLLLLLLHLPLLLLLLPKGDVAGVCRLTGELPLPLPVLPQAVVVVVVVVLLLPVTGPSGMTARGWPSTAPPSPPTCRTALCCTRSSCARRAEERTGRCRGGTRRATAPTTHQTHPG